jgi:crotonobetainyl-CoA:carnitine CoA-transferase CaiB-like acyl-CoA transferase
VSHPHHEISEPPLAGVRVLDLTRILAGPYATMKLGDMGADVIKVERPGEGDDTRAWGPPFLDDTGTYHIAVNRSKRSLTLDMKHPKAKEVLERLVQRCDVVIENFRPGTLDRLHLTWARIQELNPRAIYASISGYGQVGARRERASYDVIVQGESGVQDLTGFSDGPPTKLGISIADLVAGMHAVEGILLALYQRTKWGRGTRVDVSLADGCLALLTYQAQMWLSCGQKPRRMGNAHPSIVPYQAFEAKDGFLNVGVGNDELYRKFCEAIERKDLLGDARFATNKDRVANREALVPSIAKTLRERTVDDWLARLDRAGVPSGAILNASQALEIARTEGRGMVAKVEREGKPPLDMVGNPVKLGSLGMEPRYLPPPALGQHTDEVLSELAYSKAEIAALRSDGVL